LNRAFFEYQRVHDLLPLASHAALGAGLPLSLPG
jgi:hypothetical protein